MELKTIVERPTDVAKDPFDEEEMWLAWRMHVEAGLLHCMSNIRAGERQILQGPGKVAVLRRVRKKGAIFSGELATSVNRSDRRIAVEHPGALQ
jgi:transposase